MPIVSYKAIWAIHTRMLLNRIMEAVCMLHDAASYTIPGTEYNIECSAFQWLCYMGLTPQDLLASTAQQWSVLRGYRLHTAVDLLLCWPGVCPHYNRRISTCNVLPLWMQITSLPEADNRLRSESRQSVTATFQGQCKPNMFWLSPAWPSSISLLIISIVDHSPHWLLATSMLSYCYYYWGQYNLDPVCFV